MRFFIYPTNFSYADSMKKINAKKWLRAFTTNTLILGMLVAIATLTLSTSRSTSVSGTDNLYYNGSANQPCVSLMINVYWGNEYLVDMLKTLEEKEVTTTFFIGGSWAVQYPELLLQIHQKGHELGNHGFFHKNHDKLNYAQNQAEIYNTHKVIAEYTGINMKLFAPPSGAFSSITLQAATALGYDTIMWSRDTIDWRDHDTELILRRATNKIKNGDLILMHPTLNTALALPQIIDQLRAQGFSLVPVSSNIYGDFN